MSKLSNPAKETLLEMIFRYKISIGSKDSSDKFSDIFSRKKARLLEGFVFLIALALEGFLIYSSYKKDVGDLLTVLLAVNSMLSIVLIVRFFIEEIWKVLGLFFSYVFLQPLSKCFCRVMRVFKVKNSVQFEQDLKENYLEIKDWFQNNIHRPYYIKYLIEEMQFPSQYTDKIDTDVILKKIKTSSVEDKNYNKGFVTLDELESIHEKRESDEDKPTENIAFFSK